MNKYIDKDYINDEETIDDNYDDEETIDDNYDDEEVEDISKRLNRALILRNMKASELSAITKIGKSAISQYRSGRVIPKQDKIYIIAKALNINEAWLMGFDVPMERKKDIEDIILFVANKMRIPKENVQTIYDNSFFADGTMPLTKDNLEKFIISFDLAYGNLEDNYYEDISKEKSVIFIINKALSNMSHEELKRAEQLLKLSFPDKFSF
ncbi:helix-turn-helix domain-containing protein [Thomasclavelia ramosa]|uniref:helix-turn-helix domain-containing protein n=1 Tax=Thomasclavelia ramosa TaxID=1547 RepID=UPI00356423ED